MKRWLWILAVLAIGSGVLVHDTSRGQIPGAKPPIDGPGEGGATLKLPGAETPLTNPGAGKPALPYYPQNLPTSPASAPAGASKIALPPSAAFEINKDIEITPEAGQWVIFIISYSGTKAPEMARKFVAELRGVHKQRAYVYNYGQKEKLDEYKRVQKIRQEQIDALAKAGLKADVPIRVPAIRIEEHTGVLVGGYKTRDEAVAAAERIRKLPCPDPKKVDLVSKFEGKAEVDKSGEVVLKDVKTQFVNPFLKAFASRNPTAPQEQASSTSEEDMKFLRKINSGEPLSLLQCKKPYTLLVKQYNMQHKTLGDSKEATGFIEKFNKGLVGLKNGEWEDVAAKNAHNLAEAFRKSGLPDSYVLHCKYCSYVTIGAFDKVGDPQMTAMQNWLESRFKTDGYRQLELLPRPIVMQVPR